nr:HNH endonuclease [Cyanobacteriota bacterium]
GHKGDIEAFHWYRKQSFYDPRRAMAIRAWTEGDLRLALKLLELVGPVAPADGTHHTRQAATPLWRWQIAA